MSVEPKGTETRAKLEDLHSAVVEALKGRASPGWAARSHWAHKNPDYASYGLSTPELRRVLRGFRQSFKGLGLQERLYLAEELSKAGIEEQAHVAVHLLAISTDSLAPAHFHYLDRFVDCLHSWSVTDDFCINVLQPLLWRHTDEILQLLEKWTRSDNRWKKRASVVAFVRKAGESGEFVDHLLGLCETLIWDDDDLVQKGIGWALKDNMRGARDKIIAYVKELRVRGVPSTITLYAIRDLKGQERREILAIRRGRSG